MGGDCRDPGNWSKAAVPIWALVCGFPKGVRERRQVAMLTAYIDDSGSGHMPVYVLAGFLARAPQWARFSDDWHAILNQPNPPLKYFKMTEAAALEGEFARWKDRPELRDFVVNELVAVINKYAALGFFSVLPYEPFYSVFGRGEDAVYPSTFLYPHVLPALFLHLAGNGWPREPVDVVVDQQINTPTKLDLWAKAKRNVPAVIAPFFGDPPFERDDVSTLPLQAADMLAWNVRRRFADAAEYRDIDWPWDPVTIPQAPFMWDYDRLKTMHTATVEWGRAQQAKAASKPGGA